MLRRVDITQLIEADIAPRFLDIAGQGWTVGSDGSVLSTEWKVGTGGSFFDAAWEETSAHGHAMTDDDLPHSRDDREQRLPRRCLARRSGHTRYEHDARGRLVRKTRKTRKTRTLLNGLHRHGMRARYRLVVDSEDGNRVITFFPVGKSYTP